MKILVVEDDLALRETLVYIIRNRAPGVKVLEAGCLDEAKPLIEQADAVLCDGTFPTHPNRPEMYSVCETNWACVQRACEKAGRPFVMLSGNLSLVNRLRDVGTPAYAKPGGAIDAIRRVVALARSNAGAADRPIEDPRIQLADEENSRVEEKDVQVEGRAWWKSFRK